MQTQLKNTPIPLNLLFGYAPFNTPRYSSCGTYYTYLAPTPGGAPTIWIKRIDEKPEAARPLIRSTQRPITNYTWLKTNKHIVFIKDTDGDEEGHLFMCDIVTGIVSNISPFAGARVMPYYFTTNTHPDKIVFQSNNRIKNQYDVIQYCVTTHSWTTLAENPGNVLRWFADSNLDVRARISQAPNGQVVFATRNKVTDPWSTRATWNHEDSFMSRPISFSPCNRYFYFSNTLHTNTNLLQQLDLCTGSITQLFNDPEYDVCHEAMLSDVLEKSSPYGSLVWGTDGSLAGLSYHREKLTWKFFTDDATIVPPTLRKYLSTPEWESWIEYQDKNFIIIGRCSSTHAAEFWHYDRQTDLLIFLGSTRPELNSYQRGTTIPVSATSPDGFTIHGYLTMPTNAHGPSPLVLKIHGGPWTRDVFGFAPDTQMYATNGFACLQVNYRGSTGYGKEYCLASCKQFGAAMIDDVICLMKEVVATHSIDATRIAYTGRSYGGFSALSAGWRYQHLFKAIVALVPVTSLSLFMETVPEHWALFSNSFHYRIGHPKDDAELLKAQSPLTHAHTAKLPTLITYGRNDPRVVPAHIEQYEKAMYKSTENRVFGFENEGHWAFREENLLFQWHNILHFLNEHLHNS